MRSFNSFPIYLIFPAELRSGVYTAFNRNKYEKEKNSFWDVKRGQCLTLTISPLSVNRLSEKCEILDISKAYKPSRPLTGRALFILTI
jgi:hypothetical protein